jgi:hypothetical protein
MGMADRSSKNNTRIPLRPVIDNPMGLGYTNSYHIVVYLNLGYFEKTNPSRAGGLRLFSKEGRVAEAREFDDSAFWGQPRKKRSYLKMGQVSETILCFKTFYSTRNQ